MKTPTESVILPDRAGALANYPHARWVGDLLFVSGCSSRRVDGSHAGVVIGDGRIELDIREQTRGVLDNLRAILHSVGLSLSNVVDVTTYLADMADYAGYNEVYDQHFPDPVAAPTRTTVAVAALPHPHLLIEIKAIAAR